MASSENDKPPSRASDALGERARGATLPPEDFAAINARDLREAHARWRRVRQLLARGDEATAHEWLQRRTRRLETARRRVRNRQCALVARSTALGLCVAAAAAVTFAVAWRERPSSRTEALATAEGAVSAAARGAATFSCAHGSNSIGASLGPHLFEGLFRRRNPGANVTRATPRVDEFLVSVNGPRPASVEIAAHGSATAFSDLTSGRCELGFSSRQAKPEEERALGGRFTEHVLGLDGIGVIVPAAQNSVNILDICQIADVFSGKVQDWAELGGVAGRIHLYARNENSGTFDTFKSLVLDRCSRVLAKNVKRYESSEELSLDVSHDPQGIGFVALPQVGTCKAVMVREPGVPALLPSAFTIKTEAYPLTRRLYVYAAVHPTNPLVQEFVEFALSSEGQKIVEQEGFVQLAGLKPVSVPGCPNCSAAYKQATSGAERLPLDFRFGSRGADLDTRASRDVDRVTAFMQSEEARGKSLVLLGFSDSRGDARSNLELSLRRAEEIDAQLAARDVLAVKTLGLADEMPVADNDTEEGRAKNRRVEVWLR